MSAVKANSPLPTESGEMALGCVSVMRWRATRAARSIVIADCSSERVCSSLWRLLCWWHDEGSERARAAVVGEIATSTSVMELLLRGVALSDRAVLLRVQQMGL